MTQDFTMQELLDASRQSSIRQQRGEANIESTKREQKNMFAKPDYSTQELTQAAGIEREKEKASVFQKPLDVAGEVASGIGSGLWNAGVDTAHAGIELGLMAETLITKGATNLFGLEGNSPLTDDDFIAYKEKALKSWAESLQIKDSDESDVVYNVVKDITEAGSRFALIYSQLAKTGLGVGAKVGTAGFGEGFLNDPETRDYFKLSTSLMSNALNVIDPKLSDDFNTFLDPNTDNFTARQLTRRITNGIDASVFALAGEKVMQGGAKLAKPAIQKMTEGLSKYSHATLTSMRLAVEKAAGKLPKYETASMHAKIELAQGIAEDTIAVTKGAFDPNKTSRENISAMLDVKADSRAIIPDDDVFSEKVNDYTKKLSELVPEIQDEIVSLAKVKGIEERELLRNFAKDLGVEEAQFMERKGLEDVLRTQAQNILVDQETMKMGLASKHFKENIIDQKEFIDRTESFLVVAKNRAKSLSGAGRVLRTSREVNKKTRKALNTVSITEEKLKQAEKLFKDGMSDKEKALKIGNAIGESLKIKQFVGQSDDEFIESLIRTTDDLKTETADELAERLPWLTNFYSEANNTLGRLVQGNLLTAPATLVQNFVGSASMQSMLLAENYIKSGVGFTTGGSAKFGQYLMEANVDLNGVIYGYGKSATAFIKAFAKEEGKEGLTYSDRYRQVLADIPAFNKAKAQKLLQVDKADLPKKSKTGDVLYDSLTNTATKKLATGAWSFTAIGLQDAAMKAPMAFGAMRKLVTKEVYNGELFGVQDGLMSYETAKTVGATMLKSKDLSISGDELIALGVKKTDAMEVISRIDSWREVATQEGFERSMLSVYQTPLTGTLKKTQEFLQEVFPFGRVWTPFFSTPANIVVEALKRMPIIPVGESGAGLPIHIGIYKDIMKGGEARDEAVSKIISGNLIALVGQKLAEAGMYQPVAPNNDLNAFLNDTMGIAPGSFLTADGKSIPSGFLGTQHYLLGTGAARVHQDAIYQKVQHLDQEVEDKFYRALQYNTMNLSQMFFEQPFATSFERAGELFGILEQDLSDATQRKTASERIAKFFGTSLGNTMPNSSLQRSMHNNFSEYEKKAKGFGEHFVKQFAPSLLEFDAYDGYGNKKQPMKGFMYRYKNIYPEAIQSEIAMETGFLPKSPRFKMQVTPEDGLDASTKFPVSLNLAEIDKWSTFNERKADGMNIFLKSIRDSKEYRENLKAGRDDLNESLLRSEVNARDKKIIYGIINENPSIRDMIYSKQKEKLYKKQQRKGAIVRPQSFDPNVGGN